MKSKIIKMGIILLIINSALASDNISIIPPDVYLKTEINLNTKREADVKNVEKGEKVKPKVNKVKEKKKIIKKEKKDYSFYDLVYNKNNAKIKFIKVKKEKENIKNEKKEVNRKKELKDEIIGKKLKLMCVLEKKLKVVLKNYFRVKCISLKDKKEYELFGEAKANLQNLSLVFNPISLLDKESEKEYKVEGKVFREDKMDINMADEVNSQILEKAFAYAIADSLKTGMESYREYELNKKTVSYNFNNITVEERNMDKSYPLLMAMLSGATSFVQVIADYIKSLGQRVPYIFISNPKTLYAEVKIIKEE